VPEIANIHFAVLVTRMQTAKQVTVRKKFIAPTRHQSGTVTINLYAV